ncbi:MAG: hypothetical protein R3Y13_04120 [bacterium]
MKGNEDIILNNDNNYKPISFISKYIKENLDGGNDQLKLILFDKFLIKFSEDFNINLDDLLNNEKSIIDNMESREDANHNLVFEGVRHGYYKQICYNFLVEDYKNALSYYQCLMHHLVSTYKACNVDIKFIEHYAYLSAEEDLEYEQTITSPVSNIVLNSVNINDNEDTNTMNNFLEDFNKDIPDTVSNLMRIEHCFLTLIMKGKVEFQDVINNVYYKFIKPICNFYNNGEIKKARDLYVGMIKHFSENYINENNLDDELGKVLS